mmetsp:Transcript_6346/g.18246  ORF Transcript_6346/g.18246 Transcript_6346/m.18246 type:complete len:264 (+) Transcript_6346:216-1007(+)
MQCWAEQGVKALAGHHVGNALQVIDPSSMGTCFVCVCSFCLFPLLITVVVWSLTVSLIHTLCLCCCTSICDGLRFDTPFSSCLALFFLGCSLLLCVEKSGFIVHAHGVPEVVLGVDLAVVPIPLMFHSPDGQQDAEFGVVRDHAGRVEALRNVGQLQDGVAALRVVPSVHNVVLVRQVGRQRNLLVPQGAGRELRQLGARAQPHAHEGLVHADVVAVLAQRRPLPQLPVRHLRILHLAAGRRAAVHLHRPLPVGHVDRFTHVQ